VPKTLHSLGTVSSASHRELQCHLHNPDIESRRVWCVIVEINWMILINCFCLLPKCNNCMIFSWFKLAYPSCMLCVSCVFLVSSIYAMIVPIEWREQILVQVRIHPSGTGDEHVRRSSSSCSLLFCLAD